MFCLCFLSILLRIGQQTQTQRAVSLPLIPVLQAQNPPLCFYLLLCTAQHPISRVRNGALLRVHLEPFALQSLDLQQA